ncbi:MAG TPA: hypothetical protein VH142_16715 [Polyangiaceae bacterium]|jgi:hypothetical protein|nr:hypothetical protein [Polyangiaceae bacterium]
MTTSYIEKLRGPAFHRAATQRTWLGISRDAIVTAIGATVILVTSVVYLWFSAR